MANTTIQEPSVKTRKKRKAQGNAATQGKHSDASNRTFMIVLYAVLTIGVLLVAGLVYAVLQM